MQNQRNRRKAGRQKKDRGKDNADKRGRGQERDINPDEDPALFPFLQPEPADRAQERQERTESEQPIDQQQQGRFCAVREAGLYKTGGGERGDDQGGHVENQRAFVSAPSLFRQHAGISLMMQGNRLLNKKDRRNICFDGL